MNKPRVGKIVKKHYRDNLSKTLYKVRNCPNYETLFSMEEEFNKIGLTFQQTPKSRMILCKIEGNRPHASVIIEDYIFIGSLNNRDETLNEHALECIMNFIMNSSSAPSIVTNVARAWQNGVRTYGQIILVNEEINKISQAMID